MVQIYSEKTQEGHNMQQSLAQDEELYDNIQRTQTAPSSLKQLFAAKAEEG